MSWLACFVEELRASVAALIGLLTLMALSIIVVWPLWYLATLHTRIYSIAIVLLIGISILFFIYTRVRKFLKHTSSQGKITLDPGIRHPGPEEQKE